MPSEPITALPWWLIFSASQVTLWRECERKWGFRYILGTKTPQTPAQALGDAVDSKQLQPYLMGGRPFDDNEAGKIARVALPFLPKPMTPGIAVQKRIALASPDGRWAYQGYIDLWLDDSRGVPNIPSYNGSAIPLVEDFKTTKSLRWQKTAEKLRTDVQAQLYATYAIAETESEVVDLNWLTITTVAPYVAKTSHLRARIDEVMPQFDAIDRTGHELHDVRMASAHTMTADAETKRQFVLSLPPNLRACDDFGGCPHRHECNHAPQVNRDALVARMKEKKAMTNAASALARLKARKPGAPADATTAAPEPAPAPAAVPSPTPTPAPAPTPAPTTAAAPTPAPTPAPAAAAPAEQLPAWATAPVDPLKQKFAGINPPEKDLPPAPPVGKAVDVTAPVAVATSETPLPVPPEEPKKKRGRPAGSKNKAEGEAVTPAVEPPADGTPVKSADQIIDEMLGEETGKAASTAIETLVRAALADAFTRIAATLRAS